MKSLGCFLLLPTIDSKLGHHPTIIPCGQVTNSLGCAHNPGPPWTLTIWLPSYCLPRPAITASSVTAWRRELVRCRLMTVHFVVVFLVDCTLVEMCFNQIIAKQWVSLWFRYLQPIMFNVRDNSQTTIRQTALACQAPPNWDMHSDPTAVSHPHSHHQGDVWSHSHVLTLPPSASLLAFILLHICVILFQSRRQR